MPDQIVELQAQLDAANLQIKDLEARNKESERRVKAAAATRKQVTEGRDRMFLRYAKQHRLLQHVCNDLARAENADVRAITVCELNNWLHENENHDQAEMKLDQEIAESLKHAAPLLNILQQMVEMIDHDASIRGHVPQRWESIYERAKGVLSESTEHQVQAIAHGKASIAADEKTDSPINEQFQSCLKNLNHAAKEMHSDLFSQCCSNPIFNSWGKQLDLSSVAQLQEASSNADLLISTLDMKSSNAE
ncbi:hypothetical protein RYA05_00490 [Pseudomonas syringae pv. actinidiae]|nr:hypothetical protein [Pseudomonas syringae pv. actinidiae]